MQTASPLPVIVPYRLSWRMSLLMVGTGAVLILAAFLPASNPAKEDALRDAMLQYIAPIFGTLLIFTYLRLNVFGQSFLRLDEDRLEFKHLFGTKEVAWSEVTGCVLYSIQGRGMIGISTKQQRQGEKGFLRSVNATMGMDYAFSIPTDNLQGIDRRDLVALMKELQQKARGAMPNP